ncbi:MAG: histidine phosphatase family protein [Spirochaetales bacterium]|nr:histidine phosphatase family protein [Spirochaetales bacterium]
MKQLIIVRHAKAMKRKEGLPDFVRSLTKKGVKQAKNMVKKLKKQRIIPEVFISSPANRALETAQYFAKEFNFSGKKIILKDELYGPLSEQDFLTIVKELNNNLGSVIFFGHDPVISSFVKFLTKDMKEDMPTCSIAVIVFKKETWKEIAKGQGEITFFDYPRRNAKHYAELKSTVELEVFNQLMTIFKKVDPQVTQINEKSVKTWAKETSGKFIDMLRLFKKKENRKNKISGKIMQKKEKIVEKPIPIQAKTIQTTGEQEKSQT